MNPVIRTRWAKALESGDYGQTNQALRDPAGHCCLGVLCDIYSQDTGIDWVEDDEHHSKLRLLDTETADYLPRQVVDWAMLSDDEVRQQGAKGYDVMFPVPNEHKRQKDGTYKPMPDHCFAASSINDNHVDEVNDGESDTFGSFDDIADLVSTMSPTYKESQRGTLARPDVEDEEYDFRKYVGKEKDNE